LKQSIAEPDILLGRKNETLLFNRLAALATASMIGYPLPEEVLRPFPEHHFVHTQTGAVRALSVSGLPDTVHELVCSIVSDYGVPFAKVMAVRLLTQFDNDAGIDRLRAYEPSDSEDRMSLVIFMNPRSGTSLQSSVSRALMVYSNTRERASGSVKLSSKNQE
jgi:hypothetical protein